MDVADVADVESRMHPICADDPQHSVAQCNRLDCEFRTSHFHPISFGAWGATT
jgi:hypothetical protein